MEHPKTLRTILLVASATRATTTYECNWQSNVYIGWIEYIMYCKYTLETNKNLKRVFEILSLSFPVPDNFMYPTTYNNVINKCLEAKLINYINWKV